jgi:hypothetical protein
MTHNFAMPFRRDTEEEYLFGARMVRMDSISYQPDEEADEMLGGAGTNLQPNRQTYPIAQMMPFGYYDNKKYSKFTLF